MIKKIVIIGPESTGKSVLSEQLAAHYNTAWCREYAREYLLSHDRNYKYDDLLTIAKGQLALEEKTLSDFIQTIPYRVSLQSGTPYLPFFIDTDMYVMKVWAEFVFGKCHDYILAQIAERKYDLYLFCNIDLPWVKDELREHPDPETRFRIYQQYKDILVNQPVPWADISGKYSERLQKAVMAVDNLLLS